MVSDATDTRVLSPQIAQGAYDRNLNTRLSHREYRRLRIVILRVPGEKIFEHSREQFVEPCVTHSILFPFDAFHGHNQLDIFGREKVAFQTICAAERDSLHSFQHNIYSDGRMITSGSDCSNSTDMRSSSVSSSISNTNVSLSSWMPSPKISSSSEVESDTEF
ncbi:unnamed protein product [Albugo candida]|uniref:Uncharacterized protein n=1 Tax=Albugo candida TaxID=65357 RepID=A0A024GC92_9STRA|nr:unnamed protein product [Albugo candida]|eukprot:CCI44305.1 unnamed protein product [Albugo candida]